ncbi:DUF4235 domain-containing protein [Tessaracoccus oleiagri]|uniref:DUF4235 domain-containing protein n=1 Tax=Tessaracoccus oleiagri TaxID=686624 RepID=A0A1G9ML68_9ACTN|nr:DUF4235 domain-containing protein [Tessaracoccus oleiagri]SDL74761.1 Protein of unknown function [Tessaracoccus oleiagri]
MKITEKAIWNVYSGILGALATFVAQKLITKVWELVTGEDPPDLNDPEAPLATAIIWAAASGLGVGVTQLTMNRFVQRRWVSRMGHAAPGKLRSLLDLKK